MKQIYGLILITFFTYNLNAQEGVKHELRLLSRPLKDSILLRWAPSDYETWKAGISVGYVIERFTLVKDNILIDKPQKNILPPQPIKPLPVNQLEPLADADNYTAIAAEAMYGESFKVSAGKTPSIMDITNKLTEQENRFSFALFAADQSPMAAKASGLWFTDRNVVKGEKYLYKIYLSLPPVFAVDTGYTYTGTDEYRELPKPANLSIEGGDKLATLTWSKDASAGYYTSFLIERSNNGMDNFKPVNKEPLINTIDEKVGTLPFHYYIDTMPANDHKYFYRVRGISPFGEKGPYSDTASVTGIEQIKNIPHITRKEIFGDTVLLGWELEEAAIKQVSGFKVLRSDQADIGFKEIGNIKDNKARTFYDTKPMPGNYYKILAYNKHGASCVSFPVLVQLADSIPPAPPTGLTATADTTGKLVLRWKRNTEEDIYGYRVYRANASYEEYSQITVAPVIDTFFVDQITIKTLSKKVYYQILAVDKRQNFSGFSEPLEVQRPDIMPPVSPVITGLESTPKGVVLHWANSTSDDVVKHNLYRRVTGEKNWNILFTFKNDTAYTDSTGIAGTTYQYTLAAIDSAGLQSLYAKPVSGKNISSGIKKVSEIRFIIDRKKNCIVLTWDKIEGASEYQIYKAETDKSFTLYSSVKNGSNNFRDNNVKPETNYNYLIKAILPQAVLFYKSVLIKY